MKGKGILYSLAVIVLDIIAAASVISASIDPSVQEYKNAMATGKSYEEENLCDKAIDEYYRACQIKDSEELRMKIAQLYEKGYENGEFASLSGRNNVLDSVVRDYPNNTDSYDILIEYYDEQEDYTSCAKYVKAARENNISTKTVNDCYENVRHMYSESNVNYDSIKSHGLFLEARRAVIDEVAELDDEGNIIYITDEYGDTVAKTSLREYTEFTYLYNDGTASEPYCVIDMSAPVNVSIGEDKTYQMYYCKNYGNDLQSMETSDKVYSGIVVNGVRNCYIGENNEYEATGPYSYGMLTLKNTATGKYELFNTAGQSITKEPYDFLGCFSNSLIYSEKSGNKIIMDTNAGSVFKEKIDDVILGHGARCSVGNRMFVKFSGSDKFTMVDSESLSKMDFQCDDADLFLDSAAAFKKDGKWGFVRDDGLIVIEPKYEEAKSFSNGFAAVKENGKWGFIDKSEEIIVEPKYDDVLYFDETGTVYVYSEDEGWKRVKVFYME